MSRLPPHAFVGAVWAASLLLVPELSGAGTVVDGLLAATWLLLLLAGSVEARPVRTGLGALAGGALVAVWVIAPRLYPGAATLSLSAVAWGAVFGRLRGRVLVVAIVPLLAPVAIAALAWAAGGEAAHDLLRAEWQLPAFSFAWWSVAVREEALIVLAWLVLGARAPRLLVAAAGGVTAIALACRVASLVSFATLPADAGWSEAPLLLNLLKLHVGAPFYGPFEDCNSYQYNPTFELVHHALLGAFGLDLSLLANRFLGLFWQLCTAALLSWILFPFAKSRFARALVAGAMLLVALSSFIAWNLHPDHLLMPWFALALGVALHRDRLPPRFVLAGLVVLPAVAAAVKMTGAGIGVGLVLIIVSWPLDRRRVAAIAAGAVLAFGVLGLFEHWFPLFFRYTVALQASHPIAWSGLWKLPFEAPTRLLFVALLGLALTRPGDARRDATRVLLVTFGFALPSLLAYLKVGGRVNSLLPLTIGGAVALARIGLELADARAAVLAVWGALTVTPATGLVSSALREEVVQRHAHTVAIVQGEVAAGRHTLLFESSLAWIEAGQRDVPRDRWQSVSELVMGHHHEADASFARLASGTYDSVILSEASIDPSNVYGDRLAATLARDFALVADAPPTPGALLPPLLVFRRKATR